MQTDGRPPISRGRRPTMPSSQPNSNGSSAPSAPTREPAKLRPRRDYRTAA
jgi:hypothetical protein